MEFQLKSNFKAFHLLIVVSAAEKHHLVWDSTHNKIESQLG